MMRLYMRKALIAFLLFTALIVSVSASEKPFDVEEYASIDELAAAIVSRVPREQGAGKGLPNAPVKKIRLAIIPVRTGRGDMFPELVRRLTASDRFDVLETGKAGAFLKDKQQTGPALIKEVG